MKNFDADCIYIVTVKSFEENDFENEEVLFECAYGTPEKAREAYNRAEKMFTPHAYVEFGIRRVVFIQDDPSTEEMAYEHLKEVADREFELYYGERCQEYEEGCVVCEAYAERDKQGAEL